MYNMYQYVEYVDIKQCIYISSHTSFARHSVLLLHSFMERVRVDESVHASFLTSDARFSKTELRVTCGE